MEYLKTTFSGKVGKIKTQVKKVQAPKVMGNLTHRDLATIQGIARFETAWAVLDGREFSTLNHLFGVQK